MPYLISTASLSFVLMIGMIIMRMFELKTGRRVFLLHWRRKSDHIVRDSLRALKTFAKEKELQFIAFIKSIPALIYHLILIVKEKFEKKFAKQIDMIKGKDITKNKGSASFFINTISDYKKEMEGGSIDEE